ncbi:tripartite tricarboxylate transporter TctB family protein [Sporosarcina aquimarina]|uniref:Tripartite tricarboxylate transporter TctB family protein n=1 Tax=Sporosarcina aquimarina TaxID=114975 RepID=A0ABU4G2G1_9BACL|nr:tripartite tricarboxylate transporter TctB family protein [Sporosarcina aquimarina]MDW0111151.1 tripartite tricarboxylate transporter TctB family protein [Sporosarcina aquimarina]
MRANIIIGTLTILFSVFFLIVASGIPEARRAESVGPGEWPVIVLSFMLVMGSLLIITSIWKQKKGIDLELATDEFTNEDIQDFKKNKNVVNGAQWYIVLLIAGYILLLPIVGFLVVTPILFILLAWLLGLRKKILLIGFTIVSTGIFVVLFIYLLNIPFPRGIGIFRSMSFLVY